MNEECSDGQIRNLTGLAHKEVYMYGWCRYRGESVCNAGKRLSGPQPREGTTRSVRDPHFQPMMQCSGWKCVGESGGGRSHWKRSVSAPACPRVLITICGVQGQRELLSLRAPVAFL